MNATMSFNKNVNIIILNTEVLNALQIEYLQKRFSDNNKVDEEYPVTDIFQPITMNVKRR